MVVVALGQTDVPAFTDSPEITAKLVRGHNSILPYQKDYYFKCFIDYRTGPCYMGIKGSLCVNQLEGVVCTKTLCCASIGKAWGHPCEHCPSRLDCDIGFLKNQKTGECVGLLSH